MDEVKVDHIGIATNSIKDSSAIWEILGFTDSGEEIIAGQGAVSYTHLTLPTKA